MCKKRKKKEEKYEKIGGYQTAVLLCYTII